MFIGIKLDFAIRTVGVYWEILWKFVRAIGTNDVIDVYWDIYIIRKWLFAIEPFCH